MTANQSPDITVIDPPVPGVTVEVVPRRLRMHNITEGEMAAFVAGYGSLYAAFFGLALGAAIAFGITLTTVDLGDRENAAYIALLAVSVFATIFSGVMWFRDHSRAIAQFEGIKSR